MWQWASCFCVCVASRLSSPPPVVHVVQRLFVRLQESNATNKNSNTPYSSHQLCARVVSVRPFRPPSVGRSISNRCPLSRSVSLPLSVSLPPALYCRPADDAIRIKKKAKMEITPATESLRFASSSSTTTPSSPTTNHDDVGGLLLSRPLTGNHRATQTRATSPSPSPPESPSSSTTPTTFELPSGSAAAVNPSTTSSSPSSIVRGNAATKTGAGLRPRVTKTTVCHPQFKPAVAAAAQRDSLLLFCDVVTVVLVPPKRVRAMPRRRRRSINRCKRHNILK